MGSRFWSERHDHSIGRGRANRPKTFKSEESAKEWAEKEGLKDYKLENLRAPDSKKKPKIRVVAQ